MQDVILKVDGITKTFPGVKALDNVSFDIRPGEVHALVGENGAGKSTLMKVLAGLHQPDGGEIVYLGEPTNVSNPLDARQKGILLIHQELSLSPELSVAENIYLGAWPTNRFGVLRKKELRRNASAALEALGCGFGPDVRVGTLSVAMQQMVEIARAEAFRANVVIFDEPTASLTDAEKEQLFHTIRGLQARGVGIVYISHKMDEIFDITDRITVLRDGQVQGTIDTADTDLNNVTRMMIGRTLDAYFVKAKAEFGAEVLRVENLTKTGLFREVSFSVREGEVLGLYGLVGAGRSEVVETVFGVRRADAGKVYWKGGDIGLPTPRQSIDMGMALVPESRKEQGLVLMMGGRENTSLPHLSMFSELSVMNKSKELAAFEKYRSALSIKTTGPDQAVSQLSGGNQQKFVLAKWLCADPKLIILDEPTRGIDVGSKSAIHELIAHLAEQGLAVVVISSEMPEVLGVSHRVLAMSEGAVVAEFGGAQMTEENLIDAVSHHRGPMVAE
ncbi:ribose transport system ATP-binding protein [Rhodovulum imhoffii]|uniref:Ribose transport system ATP-binding protein n=1 Tax=Rhodovulum imhoffii TaxID=365340 RepID=A0A2T5BPL3_9RHOB|nr:sugar ABC transporter ATP-binding protein [Rhodovulum imhoffii]MBK5933567.1 D-xylose ABC transporter ATP-binding protein [Rhodovulum imhoffii]PTN01006.1 ribose transport system ATP-binding protein [Rhodovulum imhoffii]